MMPIELVDRLDYLKFDSATASPKASDLPFGFILQPPGELAYIYS